MPNELVSVEPVKQTLVAVDGFDGTGKTTLTGLVRVLLQERGISCSIVGRSLVNSDKVTDRFTQLIKESDADPALLDPLASAHLRLARIQQRIAVARRSRSDVILFDRWFMSDLSRLPVAVAAEFHPMFAKSSADGGVRLTVRLETDFETAWSRITARPESRMSPVERSGRALNESFFNQLSEVWRLYPPEPLLKVETRGSRPIETARKIESAVLSLRQMGV